MRRVTAASTSAQEAMERHVVESWQPFIVDGTLSIRLPMVVASGSYADRVASVPCRSRRVLVRRRDGWHPTCIS
jgi:hypothetical protein